MQYRATFHYSVKSYECDVHNQLKPHVVFNLFEDAAWRHTEQAGYGFTDLIQQGNIWVLSRVNIEIVDYPRWGENISFETWSPGVQRLFALRHLRISTHRGPAVVGSSSWLVLDAETKRPRRPTDVVTDETLRNAPTERATPNEPQKLPAFEAFDTVAGAASGGSRDAPAAADDSLINVGFTSIDVNGHVNNAEYVRWAMDTLPADRLAAGSVRQVEVNFLSEVSTGETLRFRSFELGSESEPSPDEGVAVFHTEGIRTDDEQPVIRTRVHLRE
jgi:acyl-ACP thioesterase